MRVGFRGSSRATPHEQQHVAVCTRRHAAATCQPGTALARLVGSVVLRGGGLTPDGYALVGTRYLSEYDQMSVRLSLGNCSQ
jgi:hypothetical protein